MKHLILMKNWSESCLMCVLRLGLLKSSKTPEFSTLLAEWVAYGMANAVLSNIDNRLVRNSNVALFLLSTR